MPLELTASTQQILVMLIFVFVLYLYLCSILVLILMPLLKCMAQGDMHELIRHNCVSLQGV